MKLQGVDTVIETAYMKYKTVVIRHLIFDQFERRQQRKTLICGFVDIGPMYSEEMSF